MVAARDVDCRFALAVAWRSRNKEKNDRRRQSTGTGAIFRTDQQTAERAAERPAGKRGVRRQPAPR